MKHERPADIERTSMAIITQELADLGIELPPDEAPVIKRVIHTSADFDYAKNLVFTPNAVPQRRPPGPGGPAAGRDDHHHGYEHGQGRRQPRGPGEAGGTGPLLHG